MRREMSQKLCSFKLLNASSIHLSSSFNVMGRGTAWANYFLLARRMAYAVAWRPMLKVQKHCILTLHPSSLLQSYLCLCIFFDMILSSLLVGTLLATAVFAAPSTLIESRVARRRSRPLKRLSSPSNTNITNVEYSSNWAGAVWDSYPSVSNLHSTIRLLTNGCLSFPLL